jgi:hypothetical protein
MKKLMLVMLLGILLLGGLVYAGGGLLTKSITFDTNTKSDLDKQGIRNFNMGEITCLDTFCITTISKEGYFKTDIKTEKYKSVVLKNSTCESNKIKELEDKNIEIENQNKDINEQNKLIEEDNNRLIKEYEDAIKNQLPTYDEFGNEKNITIEIPYPTLRDKLPLLSLLLIDLEQISKDCEYSEMQLRTDEEIKLAIEEQTKSRMNEIALYYNEKNKSKSKIDDAKIIEVK